MSSTDLPQLERPSHDLRAQSSGWRAWWRRMVGSGTALPRYVRRVAEPLIVTIIATLLLCTGAARGGSPAAFTPTVPRLPLMILWTTVGLIVFISCRRERSSVEVDRVSRAMAQSLKGLDEMRYALDQAAIVATTDHRGIITSVNDKFCAISKYSRDELIGQDHRIVNSGYHSKEFIRTLWRTIARGTVWRGEFRNRAKDGTLYWVDTTIVPFLDGRGKPRQYLSIRSEITQRKEAEAQLRAQAALTQIGQVAAMVAHEVRNPLAGLRGSLQVLDRRFAADAPDHAIIATMIARIDGLNAKVADLLQYAKPNVPRLRSVDLHTLATEVAASVLAAMGDGCRTIPVLGPPLVVRADLEMLRAALLNLTMNACQAADGGEVDIDIAGEGGMCRVAVRDRGAGLPAAVRERMFEPFVTTRPEGTGLGLAIVKRLVEPQGGRVAISDRPGGGTLAVLTLPAAAQ